MKVSVSRLVTQRRSLAWVAAAVAIVVALVTRAWGQCMSPPANLTGWWPADGASADIWGGHNATLPNGGTYTAGEVGQAFQLNGSNQFVNVAANPALNVGTGDFTVDLWVNFTSTTNEQVMAEKWVQGTGGWTLTKRSDNSVQFALTGQPNDATSAVLSIPTNTWTHFAARRGGGTLALFMNGTQIATGSNTNNLDTTSSLKFGHRGNPSDTPGSNDNRGFYLNGSIDEVHLFVGRALSDAEIQSIYTAGPAGLCVPTPVCGNGLIEAGEQCDDANNVNGDGCDNDCTISCGNGVVTSPEQCDDGNTIDGDGCDSNCQPTGCGNGVVTAGEQCDDGNLVDGDGCDSNCKPTGCGNGIISAGEQCDDGNLVDGDGCDSNCKPTGCGNGVVTSGEQCDDGNNVNGDGCDNDCTISCGNGVVTPPEQCDDGNLVDGDGCDSNCTLTGCGNGTLTSGEQCDDGNMTNTDGCKNDCTPNVCGDGVVNVGVEQCDDGNNVSGDGCESDCTIGSVCEAPPATLTAWWPANGTSADIWGGYNATVENGATYGAGHVGQAFQLDGSHSFVDVASDPGLNAGTGDFTVDLWVNFASTSGEQVMVEKWIQRSPPVGWTLTKLANNSVQFALSSQPHDATSAPLAISANTWIHFAARRANGNLAVFMNGTQVATGSNINDVSTTSSLKFGHRGSPTDTPGSSDTRGFFLNGRIDEVHLFIGYALSDAEIQALYGTGTAGLCVPPPVCGNGRTEAGEACDDGNASDDDACKNDCTPNVCGDGFINPAVELCDDGNLTDGDGCESDCTYTPVSQGVSAGGTVTTDPTNSGATPDRPVQSAVTSPNAGQVTIASATATADPSGYQVVGTQLQISAPPADPDTPLVLVLTIDASAIPPGIDPTQLTVTRNGVPLVPCTGAPGVASPDPCVESSTLLLDGDVQLTALTSHASLWSVVVRGLSTTEQKCVNGINGAGVNVANVQGKASTACLTAAAKGKEPDAQACLGADTKGKIANAAAKVTQLAGQRCAAAPPFGFTSATAVNSVAQQELLNLTADLFGANLKNVVIPTSNKAGAKCQARVLAATRSLLAKELQQFLKCKKAGLAGKPQIVSSQGLEGCFDVVAADAKRAVGRSATALSAAVAHGCAGVALPTAFPGDCGSASNFGACVRTRVACRTCRLFNAFDGLNEDCDHFDDGVANTSCQ